MTLDEWALDFYDRYVARQGGPVAQEKIRDAMGVAYSDAVDTGVIAPEVVTPYEAGRRLYERHIKPVRKRRSNSLRADGGHLLDALNGDTILGRDDPVLGRAYPLGDGSDKTLRHWTTQDWQNATTERYRNAAAVTVMAAEFDQEVAAEMIQRMLRKGAVRTGDLFPEISDVFSS